MASSRSAVVSRRSGVSPSGPLGPSRRIGTCRVDDAAGLELRDLGVRDRASVLELAHRQPPAASQVTLQGDGGAPPQLRGVPLPDHVGGVVVAVDTQRLPELRIAIVVALVAPQRSPMGTDRLVAASPARPPLSDPVHRTERWGGEGCEGAGVLGDRLRDALSASEPGGDQLPGVGLVAGAAGGARRGPPVAARHPREPVQLLGRGVEDPGLAGGDVDQLRGASQPNGTRTVVRACDRGVDACVAGQHSYGQPGSVSGNLLNAHRISHSTAHAGGKPWSMSHRRVVREDPPEAWSGSAVADGPGTATTASYSYFGPRRVAPGAASSQIVLGYSSDRSVRTWLLGPDHRHAIRRKERRPQAQCGRPSDWIMGPILSAHLR